MPLTLTVSDVSIECITGSLPEDNTMPNRYASVGALMRLVFEIEVGGTYAGGGTVSDWSNLSLTVNPGLFLPIGAMPVTGSPRGYQYAFGPSPSGLHVAHLANLFSTEAAYTNGQCFFDVTGDKVTVQYTFRLTSDLRSFITATAPSNRNRFLRANVNETTDLANTQPSIYKDTPTAVMWGVRVVGAGVSIGPSVSASGSFNINYRWFNSNLAGTVAAGELPSPTIWLRRLVAGDFENVSQLSTYEDNYMHFRIPKHVTYKPAGIGADVDWLLMRTDTLDNTGVNFLAQYDVNGFQTVEVVDETTHWLVSALVPASWLVFGATYRVMCVVPVGLVAGGAATLTNSFISDEFTANAPPPPLSLAITGTLKDYDIDPLTDNVITTVVDHIKARVVIDMSGYDADASGKSWATDFLTDMTTITLRAVDADDSSEWWVREWNKVSGVWVGLAGSYANNIEVTVDGTDMVVEFEVPVQYLNDVQAPNMGGKLVLLQWSFTAYYPTIDAGSQYDYSQSFQVKDFAGFDDVIESIDFFALDTGIPLQSMCDCDRVLVKVQLDMSIAGADTYHLRAYWNVEGYGTDNLSRRPHGGTFEEEGYASTTGLAQLDDTELVGVPSQFDATGLATFVFDHTNIGVGERVRLYVIAQKVFTIEPEDPCGDPETAGIHIFGGGLDDTNGYVPRAGMSGGFPQWNQGVELVRVHQQSGFWIIRYEDDIVAYKAPVGDTTWPWEVAPGDWEADDPLYNPPPTVTCAREEGCVDASTANVVVSSSGAPAMNGTLAPTDEFVIVPFFGTADKNVYKDEGVWYCTNSEQIFYYAVSDADWPWDVDPGAWEDPGEVEGGTMPAPIFTCLNL